LANSADYVFINGQVVTVDSDDRILEAVGVRGNRIIYVGDSHGARQLIHRGTVVIDLKGRTLLPGFIDAHCHAGMYGISQARVQCGPEFVHSIEEMKRAVARRAREKPAGALIVGRGYQEHALEEKRHPTRWDLDEAAPDHLVIIVRTCGHVVVANSRALQTCDIRAGIPDPPGGRIDRLSNGEPTGVLIDEAASQLLMKFQPDAEEYLEGMRIMNKKFLALGITSVQDASGRNPVEIRAFQRAILKKELKVRTYFMVQSTGEAVRLGERYLESGMMTGFGNEQLRLGPYKIMLDGAGSAGSAAMHEPYPKSTDYGILYFDQATLTARIQRATQCGFQVGVHAIGDRAVEMVLNSYEAVYAGLRGARPRIEHCGFVNEQMIRKMRDLGVIAILGQPFLYELGDAYIGVYGRDRLEDIYPLRALLAGGVKVALSSDSPVIDPNPLHGIYFAVAGKTKSGAAFPHHTPVDILAALRAYTMGGACASFEENCKGTIENGKLADMVVLSRSLLRAKAEEILDATVDLTMVDGEIVHGEFS
jgi:predicted amidohydrolase YtcJ